MSKYLYGIDLGTTYSCIAYQDENGRPVVVRNMDNENTMPSVVQFPPEGGVIIGKQAKETSVLYPADTISFVKQLMGVTNVAYTNKDGEDLSPSEISAFILRKLADDAGKMIDDTVTDVVITCPAYFGENERTATKQAGEIAGLNVLAILEEPTAAAIYYGCMRNHGNKTVLVYDLGGGTFDITVMKITNGEIRVICTEGNHDLGGKKWDDALSRYFIDQFTEQMNFHGEFDAESLQDIAIIVEEAKQQLSNRPSVKKMLNVQGVRAAIEITKEQFDELTVSSLLASTISLTKSAINTAKEKGIASIDEILLVGGSTMMPQVTEAIKSTFGMEPKILEPNEAVAKGAAIYAVMLGSFPLPPPLDGEPIPEPPKSLPPAGGTIRIVSASTKSFGIKAIVNNMMEEMIENLIIKDMELPIIVSETFGTLESGQLSVALEVYESTVKEKEYAVDDEYLKGEAVLQLPPNTPAGAPIEVTMELSEDGTLKVWGRNKSTGDECLGEFQSDCVLKGKEKDAAISRVTALTRQSQ